MATWSSYPESVAIWGQPLIDLNKGGSSMARNKSLEDLVRSDLGSTPGLTEKAMFGGWAFLLDSKLLLGVRDTGILVRLGPGNDEWALKLEGITQTIMRGKPMSGWVRANLDTCDNTKTRRKLIQKSLEFVQTLD